MTDNLSRDKTQDDILLTIRPVEELDEEPLPSDIKEEEEEEVEEEVKLKNENDDIFKTQVKVKPKKIKKKRVISEKERLRLGEMRKKALLVRQARAQQKKEIREAKKILAQQRRESKEKREEENEELIKNYKPLIKKEPEKVIKSNDDEMLKFFNMMDRYNEYKNLKEIKKKPLKKEIKIKKKEIPKNILDTSNPYWDCF